MNAVFLVGFSVTFIVLSMLASTFFGGVAGWLVEMVFPYVITTLNTLAGTQLTGFQVGAVLGFVGGAFRSVSLSQRKD